jgi:hypothetical protein
MRFAALSCACNDELNPIEAASKLQNAFGNVCEAREALMLAVSLIRAAQLKKPVLLAGFGEGGRIALGVSKAVEIGQEARPEAGDFPRRLITGDLCPRTGWWCCVQTERMIRAIEGQIMPSAMYDLPAKDADMTDADADMEMDTTPVMKPGIWAWAGLKP